MDILINRKPVSVPVLPIAAVALVVLFLLTTLRVGVVQPEEYGVFVNKLSGSVTVEQRPGANPYVGWIKDFYTLDKSEQSYEMSSTDSPPDPVRVRTVNGAVVDVDVTINYRLTSDPRILAERVVPECGLDESRDSKLAESVDAYKLKWIRDYARAIVRDAFGELAPKEFYENAGLRTDKANKARETLRDLLRPHGIEVLLVTPTKFDFDDNFEDIIKSKKAAEQEVRKQQALAAAAEEEQKREMATATARKNAQLATVDGELRKAVLSAEAEAEKAVKAAEAYAYSTRTVAEAEFYKAKNTAQQVLVAAQAEAEGLQQLADALSGSGAQQLLRLTYAKALARATIAGVPYATDPRIQRVDLRQGGDR